MADVGVLEVPCSFKDLSVAGRTLHYANSAYDGGVETGTGESTACSSQALCESKFGSKRSLGTVVEALVDGSRGGRNACGKKSKLFCKHVVQDDPVFDD